MFFFLQFLNSRIRNSLNPEWTTNFYTDYQGTSKEQTFVLVKIFDNEITFGTCTELASGVFELYAILSTEQKTITKNLNNGGTISVKAQEDVQLGSLNLKMSGNSLKNVRGRRKKHIPFYQFTRLDFGSSGIEKKIVYSSNTFGENCLNPAWKDEQIDIKTLCRGNVNHPILLSVYHHKSNGKHVLIGEVRTTVHDLICSQASVHGMKIQKNGKLTGSINVNCVSIAGSDSFEWQSLTSLTSEESKSC